MAVPKIPVDLFLEKMAEDSRRAQEIARKGPMVMVDDLDTEIATTPYDIVYREDRIKVKHYKPPASSRNGIRTPLLVVYALINRETMLDLQPNRSVIKSFLKNGVEVYMIDWGYPTRKDKYLTIDDHVNGYIHRVVEFVRERHQIDKINFMGICMGGTFALIYSAQHPEKIKNLITTVTPSNFDTEDGLLHIWLKYVNPDPIVDTYGNMPASLMNYAFLLLNPARLMLDKYVGLMENMDNKEFVENFIRMERWIFDSPDVPGETFRQFIRDCYQGNLLIQNRMVVGGKPVDLKNIQMPLLNIYAKFDHLVPPGACNELIRRVGTSDAEDLCLDTGHIGIYVSSKTQKEFVPKIVSWLQERE